MNAPDLLNTLIQEWALEWVAAKDAQLEWVKYLYDDLKLGLKGILSRSELDPRQYCLVCEDRAGVISCSGYVVIAAKKKVAHEGMSGRTGRHRKWPIPISEVFRDLLASAERLTAPERELRLALLAPFTLNGAVLEYRVLPEPVVAPIVAPAVVFVPTVSLVPEVLPASAEPPVAPALAPVIAQDRPLHRDYALMSRNVYRTDAPGLLQDLPGWEILKAFASTDNGYGSVAYIHPSHRHIVLAHRGLDFSASHIVSAVKALEGLAGSQVTVQDASAHNAFVQVVEYKNREAADCTLSSTGHGLGGLWAAQCVYYSHQKDDPAYCTKTFAVTFDSPGTVENLTALQSNSAVERDRSIPLADLDVVTYLSTPNLINTLHTPMGTLYRIDPILETERKAFLAYLLHTLDTHSMAAILAGFDPMTGMPKRDKHFYMRDWPTLKPADGIAFWSGLSSNIATLAASGGLAAGNFMSMISLLSLGPTLLQAIKSLFVKEIKCPVKVGGLQYDSVWEYLDKAHGYHPEDSLSFEDSHFLKYASHYDERPFNPHQLPLLHIDDTTRAVLSDFVQYQAKIRERLPAHSTWLLDAYSIEADLLILSHPDEAFTALHFRNQVVQFLKTEEGKALVALLAAQRPEPRMERLEEHAEETGIVLGAVEMKLGETGIALGAVKAELGKAVAFIDEIRVTHVPALPIDAQYLSDFYRSEKNIYIRHLMTEDRWSIEQGYVNLSMIRREEVSASEGAIEAAASGGTKAEVSELAAFDQLYQPRIPVLLDSVLPLGRGKENTGPVRLLVEGRAGVGKSTFCQYLAHQWAKKEWGQEYDYLIFISLKEYQKAWSKGKPFEVILSDHYQNKHRLQVLNVTALLNEAQKDKLFFVFDGFDEIMADEAFKKHFEEKFILAEQGYHWLVTTRPQKLGLLLDNAKAHLEIMGLSPENITKFVETYFNNLKAEKAERLLSQLNRVPALKGLAAIPVILEIICFAESNNASSLELQNLTGLYLTMFRNLSRRYQEKHPEASHSTAQHLLTKMGALAWRLMQEGRVIMDGRTDLGPLCANAPELQMLLDFGLIRRFGGTKETKEKKQASDLFQYEYFFIHLTFQECLAAWYVVSQFNEVQLSAPETITDLRGDRINFRLQPIPPKFALQQAERESAQWLAAHHQDQRYRMMFIFMAGMSTSLKEEIGQSLLVRFKDLFFTSTWRLGGLLSREVSEDKLYQTILWMSLLQESWVLDFTGKESILVQITDNFIAVKGTGIRKMTEELNRLEIIKKHVLESRPSNEYFARLRRASLDFIVLTKLLSLTPLPSHLQEYLLQTLQHPDVSVREAIVQSMGEYRGENEVFIAHLFAMLDETKKHDSLQAKILTALIQLLWQFKSIPEKWRASSLQLLQERFILELLLLLKDTNCRYKAAEALGKVAPVGHPAHEKAIGSLLFWLKNPELGVRRVAAEALGKVAPVGHPAHEKAIRSLLFLLEDDDVGISAAEALDKVAPVGHPAREEAIRSLLPLVKDTALWWTSNSATKVLGRVAPQGHEESIRSLLGLLANSDSDVRRSAAEALGKVASQGHEESIHSLLLLLKEDHSSDVKNNAAAALGQVVPLGHEKAIRSLLRLLKNTGSYVNSAAEALGKVAPQGHPAHEKAIRSLLFLLKNPDLKVRRIAAEALGKVTPQGHEESIRFLLPLLKDPDFDSSWVRENAAKALGKIIPQGHEKSIRSLLFLLKDSDSGGRRIAAKTLGKVAPLGHEEVLRSLLLLLKDPEIEIRANAALAFAEMWSNNQAAATALPGTVVEEIDGRKYQVTVSYEYQNQDITAIFQARLRAYHGHIGETPIYAIVPVDTGAEHQLKQRLLEDQHHEGQRVVLIPCNLGNNHWVGLLFAFDERGLCQRAEYIDSTRSAIPVILQQQLQAVYPGVTFRERFDLFQQEGAGASSGACAVENLVLAMVGALAAPSESISAIRARQLAALTADIYAVAPGPERETRQAFLIHFEERQRLSSRAVEATPSRTATVLRDALASPAEADGGVREEKTFG